MNSKSAESSNTKTKEHRERRKPALDMSAMVYGKIPPQAKDLEEAIIGAILIDKSAFDTAIEIVNADSFYVDHHQRIFKAMQSLAQKSLPIDMLTVIEELKAMEMLENVGGPYYIAKCTNAVVSVANVEAHCRIVQQKFLQREMIRIGSEIMADGFEDATDVFDLMDSAEQKLSRLIIDKTSKPYKTLGDAANRALTEIIKKANEPEGLSGITSGLKAIDDITQGWQKSDFIIIAARPSIGKSVVAANLLRKASIDAEKPIKSGAFLLEMRDVQYAINIMSAETEIDKRSIKTGKLTEQQLSKLYDVVGNKFKNDFVFLDDSSSLNIFQFKTKARRMVEKEKVGLIILDYLQLMSGVPGQGDIREQEIAKISREIKQLAKELEIPIIALSQIARKGENDPSLSTLRESGALEQDADVVIFLVPETEEAIKTDKTLKDTLYFKFAKHRDGALDRIPLRFVKEIQKIMAEGDYQDYMNRRDGNIQFSTNGKSKQQYKTNDFSEGVNSVDVGF